LLQVVVARMEVRQVIQVQVVAVLVVIEHQLAAQHLRQHLA
jgi:hypothetical protein